MNVPAVAEDVVALAAIDGRHLILAEILSDDVLADRQEP